MSQNGEEIATGWNKKIATIVILSMMALRQIHMPNFASANNELVASNSQKAESKKTGIKTRNRVTASTDNGNRPYEKSKETNVNKTVATYDNPHITASSLPVYLTDPATNTIDITSWGLLAPNWNRTTQYHDLFQNKPSKNNPNSIISYPSISHNKRPVIIIHCGPKTGSTTLRYACHKNLKQTCGIKTKGVEPKGYFDATEFFEILRECNDTHYFCKKVKSFNFTLDEIGEEGEGKNEVFEDLEFIHLYPFRNYDEWAASALKQAFDRGGETGCAKAARHINKCEPSHMEIDFRKYSKTDMSKFKESIIKRINELGERHHFLLYNFRELDIVLDRLSDFYGLPKLEGSDGTGKVDRPEGTCNEALLRKFHDCYSHQLMELR